MVAACVEPLPLYRPRDPQASDLWRLPEQHFETFQQVYDERFAAKYGFWGPIVERLVKAFLKCGDLQEGFARVRCPDCHHEMFVAFSCKQRCTCPSCHQKRALLTSIHVAEEVCAPVAHRQVVLTIPKRLRLHTRFDRQLLGQPDVRGRGHVLVDLLIFPPPIRSRAVRAHGGIHLDLPPARVASPFGQLSTRPENGPAVRRDGTGPISPDPLA